MDNNHEMSLEKRRRIFENLRIYDEEFERRRERKRLAELQRLKRKREIIVKNIFDLTEKYEDYLINVDSKLKIVTLRRPLEVKYLALFRKECEYLGFTCEIKSSMINDLYHSNI